MMAAGRAAVTRWATWTAASSMAAMAAAALASTGALTPFPAPARAALLWSIVAVAQAPLVAQVLGARRGLAWPLASAAGAAVGWQLASTAASQGAGIMVTGFAFGLAAGCLQALALHGAHARASLWPALSALAVAGAWVAGAALAPELRALPLFPRLLELLQASHVGWVTGAVTATFWLLPTHATTDAPLSRPTIER